MDHLFDQAAERIGRAYETAMLSESPFHLSPCGGCGGPSFQQPCALCGYYPMGLDRGPSVQPATAERFRRSVEASGPDGTGNLATWYFRSFTRNMAYKNSGSYRARVDALIAEGAGMTGLPSPDDVFRHVSVEGNRIRREARPLDAMRLWRAVQEVSFAFGKESEEMARPGYGSQIPSPRGLRDRADEAARLAVAAIHGDEEAWGPAVEGLSYVVSELKRTPARWVPVGNLNWAREELEKLRESREQAIAAPTP